MRAAPLKGDCLICQAPEPTRVAINAAIWPGEGMVRAATYRSDGEVPISTEFSEVMDTNARVGMKATHLLERLLDEAGEIMAVTQPKLVLEMATKLGMSAATSQEASRLKRNQQKIDVLAIFGLSSGHVRPPRADVEQDAEVADLRAELNAERKLLDARASVS